ncbi:hypothetical protein [Sneathiella chinensis]|uniref:ACT domain-containing protein n=1 Tax=Sneathiella chinensis TaxID=349750 RepID=A0ABQ5U0U5_9PROT|nr:hypothetical protein [Sneathiella chinensis]GLQ05822.1 hypothetical protein GCM10007924_10430 [Sneathiella chinensis]
MTIQPFSLPSDPATSLSRDAQVEARFTIQAVSEPSALPRILENFALRNMVPTSFSSVQHNNELTVTIVAAPFAYSEAAHLQLRLQNILPVLSVAVEIFPLPEN